MLGQWVPVWPPQLGAKGIVAKHRQMCVNDRQLWAALLDEICVKHTRTPGGFLHPSPKELWRGAALHPGANTPLPPRADRLVDGPSSVHKELLFITKSNRRLMTPHVAAGLTKRSPAAAPGGGGPVWARWSGSAEASSVVSGGEDQRCSSPLHPRFHRCILISILPC